MTTPPRPESLRLLEHEVGVLIRRVKRVIGQRSRAVHADLQPSSYLMLAYLAETGPMRSSALAEAFDVDKGAVSRQVQHLTQEPDHPDLDKHQGQPNDQQGDQRGLDLAQIMPVIGKRGGRWRGVGR